MTLDLLASYCFLCLHCLLLGYVLQELQIDKMKVKELIKALENKNEEYVVTEIDCIFFVGPSEEACFQGREALEFEEMMPEGVSMLNR